MIGEEQITAELLSIDGDPRAKNRGFPPSDRSLSREQGVAALPTAVELIDREERIVFSLTRPLFSYPELLHLTPPLFIAE